MNSTRYAIITPVRNEEAFLPGAIASVLAQTIRPMAWIIVNDGSTDRTGEIASAAAAEHSWIRVITRADRGFRKPGTGVMEAFHEGYEQVRTAEWEYLAKLDGDLSFAADFFERCFRCFESHYRLGIGGGLVCNEVNGQRVLDSSADPKFHVRGATKIYRRACWEDIGGLIRATGWDTMDELRANMLGWKTFTFPDIELVHHRKTGEADGSWRNWFKNGRANYIVGYHPLFMFSKCLKRAFRRPYAVAAVALGCGFVSGYWSRPRQRVDDRELIRYLRDQQMRALTGKKCLWRSYELTA